MAEINRYQRGLDIIKEYTVEGNNEISTVPQIQEAFKDIAPDLEELVVEFGFGDIYSREGLTNQQRTHCHNRFSCNSRYGAAIGIAYQLRT